MCHAMHMEARAQLLGVNYFFLPWLWKLDSGCLTCTASDFNHQTILMIPHQFKKYLLYFMCLHVKVHMFVYAPRVCLVPRETRKGRRSSWGWSCSCCEPPCVGAGCWSWTLCKDSMYSSTLSCLPSFCTNIWFFFTTFSTPPPAIPSCFM